MIEIPIGGRARAIEVRASPDETLRRLEIALREVGKVKEVSASQHRVRGSIRYGLQKVLVKAHVQQEGELSTVSLKALGSDVWGVGAKKVLERWVNALAKES